MAEKDLQEIIARLDALEARNTELEVENAALRGVPSTSEVEVIFTQLAVATDAGPNGEPVRNVRGRPDGKVVKMRADRANAWVRRGKALLAGSPEAAAWLKDKEARDKAASAASIAERKEADDARKREQALAEAEEAARAKAAAAA